MISRQRRLLLAGTAAAALTPRIVLAQANPGVTATELKIGTTTSLSGPVSALGTINKAQGAYFKMVNDQGGVGGRKINYLILDDGFNPAKTLEQTRRLVEEEEVAFLFSQLGTGPNSAIVKYVNDKGVPHLFLSVNGDKWGDYKTYPWTLPFAPSARTEGQIFIKYALQQNPRRRSASCTRTTTWAATSLPAPRTCWGRSTTRWSRPRPTRSPTRPSIRS